MQVTLCKEPFEYIIIDNTYTEEELKLIFLELDFWSLSNNLMGPEHTGTAKWSNGNPKKKNKGVFLDDVYTNRSFSNILKFNRKIYNIEIQQPSVIFNFLKESLAMVSPDNTSITKAQWQAWMEYRKKLQEINLQTGYPHEIFWPTKPE